MSGTVANERNDQLVSPTLSSSDLIGGSWGNANTLTILRDPADPPIKSEDDVCAVNRATPPFIP